MIYMEKEKILVLHSFNKRLTPRIYKELGQIDKKTTRTANGKTDKQLTGHFTKAYKNCLNTKEEFPFILHQEHAN